MLIVDDAPTIRAQLRVLLSSEFEVVAAATAESALSICLARAPDIIISDVMMPGMDGHEFCRRVRAEPSLRETPFVLMTSNLDPDGRASGLEDGADDYLPKPVRERELLARVRSLLRLREARFEILQQKDAIHHAHQELLTAQRQLLDAEKLGMVGMLASGVAHELNNPLAFVLAGSEQIIRAMEELIGEVSGPPRPREELLADVRAIKSEVREGTERIRGLVRDLTMLASDRSSASEWVEASSEIERALVICGSHLEGIEVVHQLSHPRRLHITPGYLTQIVVTLLTNAADAVSTRKKPSIAVETQKVDDGVEVSVTDNGSGIPQALLPYLFDPFFTTKRAGQGVGLGLAICFSLVNKLGGHMKASSEDGKGSRFSVWMPTRTLDVSLRFQRARMEASRLRLAAQEPTPS
ncbi:MAG: sensor histidine kinase [Myxococcaceae bacterium]